MLFVLQDGLQMVWETFDWSMSLFTVPGTSPGGYTSIGPVRLVETILGEVSVCVT